MRVQPFFIVPAVLGVVTVGYIVASPSGDSVGQEATPEAAATVAPAVTASATLTGALPDGASGVLTYRHLGEVVRVQLPGAVELSRAPASAATPGQTSADGLWRADSHCVDEPCTASELLLTGPDSVVRVIRVERWVDRLEWSPTGHKLAVRVGRDAGSELVVIDDPAVAEPRGVAGMGTGNPYRRSVGGFTWAADGRSLYVASGDYSGGMIDRIGLDGGVQGLHKTAGLPPYLYPSPARDRFAYTAQHPLGWQIYVYDAAANDIIFSGNMGSDGPGGQPVTIAPGEQKGPMYIAWSPDGTKLAFGGGFAPPYVMTTIDVESGAAVKTEFPHGYPGEIKWNAGGSMVAVSTYDPGRTRHETYAVDPATGAARHLLSGCTIVWSPDGRFLAVHGETEPGIAIVDVTSGAYGHLTRELWDTPAAWEP